MMIRCVAPGISLFAFDSARGFIGTLVRFDPPVSPRPAMMTDGLVRGYCRLRACNVNLAAAAKLAARDRAGMSHPMMHALAALAAPEAADVRRI